MLKYIKGNKIIKSKPIVASFWFLFASFLNSAVSMLTTPIYTRLLTPSDYATVSIYNAWSGILSVIFTLSIAANAFHVGLVKYQSDKSSFIASMIGLTGLLVSIGFMIFKLGEGFFTDFTGLSVELFNILFIGLFLNVVLGFWTLYKKNEYEYKAAIIVNIAVTIIAQIITIIVVSNSETNLAFLKIFYSALPSYIVSIILGLDLMRRGKVVFSIKYWKFALLFCLPLIPHYMANHFLSQIDRIIIGMYHESKDVAIYSVAYTLSSVISMLWGAIGGIFIPWLYKNIKNNCVESVKNVILAVSVVLALSSIFIMLLGPEIMSILGPKSYSSGALAIPPIITGTFIFIIVNLQTSIKMYFEDNRIISIVTIFAGVFNIILNFIFVPQYGFIGAAYTTLASYFFMLIFHLKSSSKVNLSIYFKNEIYYIIFGMMLLSFLMNFLYMSYIIRYIGIIIFLIIIIRKSRKLMIILSGKE